MQKYALFNAKMVKKHDNTNVFEHFERTRI